MKHIFFILFSLILAGSLSAQDIHKTAKAKTDLMSEVPPDTAARRWLVKGTGSLQFTQAGFSNWASGGTNSLGLVAWVNFKANYKSGKHIWANKVDMGYGFNLLGNGNDAKYNKTDDKIEITTAYGYELHKNQKWYLTLLANFRTQFTPGYEYPTDSTEKVISKFMAPAYLVVGLGITYAPAKWFSLYVSPVSGRFTFVNDTTLANAGSFGVDAAHTDASGYHSGKTMRGEFGPYLRADLNKDLAKNINLTTSVELFTDYLKDFGNIDVNWSLLLSMKVNKWLAASIQTQLIYDDAVMIQPDPTERARPMTQFKEMLGLGLTYNFN
jgi:hypothetical protein